MSSHSVKRRATLIALVTGVSGPIALASVMTSCGHAEATKPAVATDTIEVASAAGSDSAPPKYKPVATTTASIRPRPADPAPQYLATAPPGFRCYSRGEEATCLALGDQALEEKIGASAARTADDGPVAVQTTPQAPVQCCYHPGRPQVMRGRPMLVSGLERIPRLQSRDDWS